MSDPATPRAEHTDGHDHAWRKMPQPEGQPLLVGEYRCDLCQETWSL